MARAYARADAHGRGARGRGAQGARGVRGVHDVAGPAGAAGAEVAPRRPTCARSARSSSSPSKASRTRWGRRSTTAATCSTRARRSSTGRSRRSRTRAQRAEIMAAERAARDRARVPFLAPVAPEIAFTRFATTGRDAARGRRRAPCSRRACRHPERVFGVYRVPDRHDLSRSNEGEAFVEWEIAHAPGALAGRRAGRDARVQARLDHWAARRPGEPSVLDEDVAGALIARARVAPEDCFGLTACSTCAAATVEDGTSWTPHVEGVLLFTRPLTRSPAHRQLMAAGAARRCAPAAVPPRDPRLGGGRRVGLAAPLRPAAHAPRRSRTCRAPGTSCSTPTWRSSACAAQDCYGVQVTRTAERCSPTSRWRASAEPGRAEAPVRRRRRPLRMHAAEHVVIAYRDRPEYEAGPRALARLPARGPARPPRPPDRRAAADRGRRPPAPVVPVRGLRHVRPVRPGADVPADLQPQRRPSLGPYCGELD